MLTEAIDGTLGGERREDFERHKAGCAACNTLFAEASSGAAWLDEMEEVVPPRNLVHNIMAATSGTAQPSETRAEGPSGWERLRRQVRMVFAPVLTPRFGMSMGMAFFSITLVLNMAQIRIKDLTPHNLSRTFYSSQNKVMKYYENMRLVYEIESRVRELRNASDESEREQKNQRLENNSPKQEQNQNNEPERRQHGEFSHGQNGQVLVQCFQTYTEKRVGRALGSTPGMIAKQKQGREL
jgi:hypothetical protein